MPKIITEAERKQVIDAIYHSTIALIQQKGVRKVTVEDIAEEVGISKGSFYTYYLSKEACIYQSIRRNENELFSRMEEIMSQDMRDVERVKRFLREVMFAPDCVMSSVSSLDLEVLLRKLPPEYRESEQIKSDNYFHRSLELLKVSEEKMEAVAMLTDCLNEVAANSQYSEKGKQQALDVLIAAMAEYLAKGDME